MYGMPVATCAVVVAPTEADATIRDMVTAPDPATSRRHPSARVTSVFPSTDSVTPRVVNFTHATNEKFAVALKSYTSPIVKYCAVPDKVTAEPPCPDPSSDATEYVGAPVTVPVTAPFESDAFPDAWFIFQNDCNDG